MTSDYDNNSEQSVEIDTVAKSLPHFYLIRRTACKQKDYKILPKLRKITEPVLYKLWKSGRKIFVYSSYFPYTCIIKFNKWLYRIGIF